MPYRNMDETELRSIRWIEASNAVATGLMVVILLGAVILLDQNQRKLDELKQQLAQRNVQGGRAVELLTQAVDRLDKLQPPVPVQEVPAR